MNNFNLVKQKLYERAYKYAARKLPRGEINEFVKDASDKLFEQAKKFLESEGVQKCEPVTLGIHSNVGGGSYGQATSSPSKGTSGSSGGSTGGSSVGGTGGASGGAAWGASSGGVGAGPGGTIGGLGGATSGGSFGSSKGSGAGGFREGLNAGFREGTWIGLAESSGGSAGPLGASSAARSVGSLGNSSARSGMPASMGSSLPRAERSLGSLGGETSGSSAASSRAVGRDALEGNLGEQDIHNPIADDVNQHAGSYDQSAGGSHDTTSSAAGGLGLGHAWLSVTDSCGKTTLYGLFPDSHERTEDNGAGKDIRQNMENGYEIKAQRFYEIPLAKIAMLKQLLSNQSATWKTSYNCSSWASEVWNIMTGEDIDARRYYSKWETPRALAEEVSKLEETEPTSKDDPKKD